ncbi:unnamed protein product [Clonostachys rhizophaga]|uniref:Fe2OG dioxygenase domain-containing protein n=1 Tax=Clonostachys rhizophaga TaxID=160324 RepID=A0A9N9V781_9HYPO|nr:unnamed protein product [Clonostachys rhizophaga]
MAAMTYTTIELATPNGPEYRRVSTKPPRLPEEDEMPVIDLGALNGDFAARKELASQFRTAAEKTGFFYVRNHGIPEDLIQSALSQIQTFFDQPEETKESISLHHAGQTLGYLGVGGSQINNTESRDRKETFSMRYDPRADPKRDDNEPADESRSDAVDQIWEKTSHLKGFQDALVEFWQKRLELVRRMIRIMALALDLPESYFDAVTTHPGADAVYIHYPPTPRENMTADVDVGIGSHTDIQCITLLWQDNSGGLQVLTADGEWLDARPLEGTLVVNIGDFLQRLSNNRFKSTVHRVYNRKSTSRYSMPFFLGFNPEATLQVVPTCVDKDHPALYEPISCGKV